MTQHTFRIGMGKLATMVGIALSHRWLRTCQGCQEVGHDDAGEDLGAANLHRIAGDMHHLRPDSLSCSNSSLQTHTCHCTTDMHSMQQVRLMRRWQPSYLAVLHQQRPASGGVIVERWACDQQQQFIFECFLTSQTCLSCAVAVTLQ